MKKHLFTSLNEFIKKDEEFEHINELISTIPTNLTEKNPKDIDKQILRIAIVAELDAINLYEQMADLTKNKKLKSTLLDIAKEEKIHIGEFETLLLELDKEYKESLEDGKKEVEE
jgi:rubrerythrin